MQVGINTSSFSHLKFNFEFAGQKLKSIEKGFQIGSCKIIQSYRLSLSSLRLGQQIFNLRTNLTCNIHKLTYSVSGCFATTQDVFYPFKFVFPILLER